MKRHGHKLATQKTLVMWMETNEKISRKFYSFFHQTNIKHSGYARNCLGAGAEKKQDRCNLCI